MANQSNNARRRPARRTRQRAQNRDSFFGKLLIMLAVAIAIVLGLPFSSGSVRSRCRAIRFIPQSRLRRSAAWSWAIIW